MNRTVIVSSDGANCRVEVDRSGSPRAPPPVTEAAPAQPTGLQIVSVTSPVQRGSSACLRALTAPGAACKITVYYKSGPSKAAGLEPKTADSSGNVSWTWKVGSRTSPGAWRIVVSCSSSGQEMSEETSFVVTQ